jgi:PAS domain S-box-containing protein
MAGEPSPDRYGIGLVRKDGTRLDAELSVKTVAGGGQAPLIVALVRDVTQEKRRAWQTREAEERYRLLVDSVQEYAILMLDPEGLVMSWNPGAQRILGYAPQEVLGRHVSLFYPPEDAAAGAPQEALRLALERGRLEEEGWRIRRDGTRFRAGVALAPLRGPDGEVHGFAHVTRDLTLQHAQASLERRAEEQASRTRELETFSYTVAHDLRAPLRGMIHLTEFLERDQADRLDDEGRQNLHALRTSAERMGRLVEDLLNLSRSSNAEIRHEDVDLTKLARHVLKGYQEREPGRDVDIRVQEGLRARADPNLMRVLLDNLLGNAWKFTRKTPRPRIEMGSATVEGAEGGGGTPQGASPRASTHAFYVRDNGAGFDPAKSKDLFKPFRRLHAGHEYEGTGIGLATVERIVSRHGGKVWAEGQPGQGATVWFTLPDH